MWRQPVLPQINTLPGAKCTTPFTDGKVQIGLSQNAPHMRGHVVRTLIRVGKHWITIGSMPLHESFKVMPYGRVGVFTQHQ